MSDTDDKKTDQLAIYKLANKISKAEDLGRDKVVAKLLERNDLDFDEFKSDPYYLRDRGYMLDSDESEGFNTYSLYELKDAIGYKLEVKSDIVYKEFK